MALNEFSRTETLLGEAAVEKLRNSRVAVFGIGGVGGHAAEALARSGVGALDFFDNDDVSLTNINRQIVALHSTVGRPKVDVMKERVLDINPLCSVTTHRVFILPENLEEFDFSCYDYIIDAIDTVTAKVALAVKAQAASVPMISSMGTGNKLDPLGFIVTDISKTEVCPLARVMRKKLKDAGVRQLKVLYSKELPKTAQASTETKGKEGRPAPASISFVPSVAGLVIGGEVIKDLIK